MFKSRKFKSVILFVLLFSLVMPVFAFASSDTTNDVITELKKKPTNGPLNKVQTEVKKFSTDIFNIVRLVVVAILIVSIFMNMAAFSKAGDNPALKASLKAKMIWAGAGAILAINFWNIINLFTGIKIL